MAHEAAMSEESAVKAMMDAARLAEELRTEQDIAMATERDRKLLEAQVKDLVTRCDEAETNALKVCKMIILCFGRDDDFLRVEEKLSPKWNTGLESWSLRWMPNQDDSRMLRRT